MSITPEKFAAYQANRKIHSALVKSSGFSADQQEPEISVNAASAHIKKVLSDAETPAVRRLISKFFTDLKCCLEGEILRLDTEATQI